MREIAYAKVNLALHVRAREPDGYHRIETLFAFCEHGDALEVAEADEIILSVDGPFAEAVGAGEDNLVLRAARALAARHGVTRGAALHLDKSLPVAAGIGGGSADAAAALRLLARFWWLDADEETLCGIAAGLGADVPACVVSRTVRGDNRGDVLTPSDENWSGTPILLVNPRVPVSTPAVFARWDGLDRGPLGTAHAGRNDLESPARSLAPEVGDLLSLLGAQPGTTLVRMSGSGATCFACFEDEPARDAAAAALEAAQPDWWTLATRLR
ncbi:4-(cytidine 5'-diphospho)-2-C-methyl-D-erythritol kinase [Allosphingosinicella indica]|uniref:4-diphosphocytidyl-2-C-methyl-D-erythritol kinase n=1 Tax=Allosphingosinicella indica TaxID=941907 RepID=A0A1X7FXS7_9SPHN|nr:4-(cytidine 5'-diphospho)-2-C-methyl-D-erythritol kinase [Allosphingosinicella indica]SMF60610.1 4-diphosphocytidyl-2-C-methyl-D-erythritol kinase [Allosphingosinicella indica]